MDYGSIIGAAIQTAGNIAGNAQNQKYYTQNQYQNWKYNEMSADLAYKRQKDYYENYLSPQAMLKQYEEAGLSPGLMYSGSGTGGSGGSAPQGNGASGPTGPYMNLSPMQGAEMGKAIEKMQAEIKNLNADTEGKEIQNADDPELSRYISEKQQAIKDANTTEAELTNKAFTDLQTQLTNINVFSNGTSISISHAHGSSGSEANGWTLNVSEAKGQTHSFNLGGSVSANVGLTNGGSVSANYGKSEGHNEAHAHGESQNTAKSWAKNVADALGISQNESGNRREAINVLEIFYNQISEISRKSEETRQEAKDNYEYRVWKYERNREKQRK